MHAETLSNCRIVSYDSLEGLKKRDKQKIQKILNDRYLRDPEMKFFVAFDEENELCGVLAYKCEVERGAEIFLLKEIFVEDEYRSQGIGSQLMSEFEGIAGSSPKQLTVLASNERAIAFYRRLGYDILNAPSAQVLMEKE